MADTYEAWLRERHERSAAVHERLSDPNLDAEGREAARREIAAIREDQATWDTRRESEQLAAEMSIGQDRSEEVAARVEGTATRDHNAELRRLVENRGGEFEMDLRNAAFEHELTRQGVTASDMVTRAQTTVDGSGGYTIPTDLERTVYMGLLSQPGVRGAGAQVIRTAAGNDRDIAVFAPPTVDLTQVLETGETANVTASDMAATQVKLRSSDYTAMVDVSLDLLQDTAVNLSEVIGRSMSHTLGAKTNKRFTDGTGVNMPEGFMNGRSKSSTNATVAAGNTNVTLPDLNKVFAALPVGYIDSSAPTTDSFGMPNNRGLSWQMHPAVWTHIVSKEGTDGHPIFGPYSVERLTRSFIGFPVTFNENLNSDVGTNTARTKHMATLGNFYNAYVIREAGPIMVSFSEHSRFSERIVQYLAVQRVDGRVRDQAALRHLFLV